MQVYSDYVDAFRTGDKERWAGYLRFQNDVVRQFELDNFYPSDLTILGWEQLKENLWVVSAQYELVYVSGETEMQLIYNFVTEDDQGWYVIRDAHGNVLPDLVSQEKGYWKDIWYAGDYHYGELDLPTAPETAGDYSLSIYFNGFRVATMDLRITG